MHQFEASYGRRVEHTHDLWADAEAPPTTGLYRVASANRDLLRLSRATAYQAFESDLQSAPMLEAQTEPSLLAEPAHKQTTGAI